MTDILYKNDTVSQIYRVTGRDRLHVHAVASSGDEMEYFLHNVIDACLVSSAAAAIQSYHVLKILKDCVYNYISSFLIKELFENLSSSRNSHLVGFPTHHIMSIIHVIVLSENLCQCENKKAVKKYH